MGGPVPRRPQRQLREQYLPVRLVASHDFRNSLTLKAFGMDGWLECVLTFCRIRVLGSGSLCDSQSVSSIRVGMEAVMVLKRTNEKNANSGAGTASPALIRWLIRRDMDEVLAIERGSFEFPWTEEEFLCCLRQRNCIGTVAEQDHAIVGFMIYELHQSMLRIMNFAVSPDHRRSGVGQQMIQRLIDKLSQQRRREIVLEVRETNVAAQLFFSSCQFRALSVLRNHYDDTSEDAYYMRYSLRDSSELYKPMNRLRDFGNEAA